MYQDRINLLKDSFWTLVEFASAKSALDGAMPDPPKGRTYLLAIGKAAAAMAAELESQWPADAPLSGIALTRYGHGQDCASVEVIEASHPVPDTVGHDTAQRVVRDLTALGESDLFVCLISGGGSALLSLPAPGITVEEKQSVNKQLLASGHTISAMNCLRKHISAVKGGRLAALASPARIHTIAVSDVPGNDLSTIASGPTVPDATTRDQALDIAKSLPQPPQSVLDWLANPESETPKSGPEFIGQVAQVTVTPESAFDGLIKTLDGQIDVEYLGADLEGEAADLGRAHARKAVEAQGSIAQPLLILSGGETTVTFDPSQPTNGRGGRNCEYLLSLFTNLQGQAGVYALAADTDGIDGSEDNAGAWIGPEDWARSQTSGLDPAAFLARHDSYGFFEALDLLLKPGPTRTNVNDFRAILVVPMS